MKKILFMGDSPTHNTGFAYVLRNILKYLSETKKFEIHCIGWHYDGKKYDTNEFPYPIYQATPYGEKELLEHIKEINPEIIFTLGDLYMLRKIPNVLIEIKKYQRPKWVAYFPVDSFPLHSDDKYLLKYIDYPITYSDFAIDSCKDLANNIIVENIPHGIWVEKYKTNTELKKIIKQKQGFENKFVVGFVGTNQTRKQPYRLLESFKKFTCKYYNETHKCKHCLKHCDKYENCKPDSILYLHTQFYEKPQDNPGCGFDLYELINRYKLQKNIWNTPQISYVKGLSEPLYIMLMNCFNVLWNATQGEGCGIPTMELSLLGVPVLTTKYSANEYNPDKENLIDVSTFEVDINLSTNRALSDTDHTVERFNHFYSEWKDKGETVNEEYINYIKKNFDFVYILNRWEKIFEVM